MITNLADSIAHFFVRKGWGSDQNREIYRYGCEVILSALISILLVIGCGLLFRMTGAALLFYLVFLVLRRYCGGYHAETYLRCNTIFTITMVLVLFGISEYQTIPSYALVIASVVSFLIVAWFSPVSHKNKPLKKREIVIYQKVAVSISGVLLSLVIILLQFEREIATIITLAMLTTSIAMIVSVVMERSEKNERNCNAR